MAARVLLSLALAGLCRADQVELYGANGEREEVLPISPSLPAGLCSGQRPPLIAWPVMQVVLVLQPRAQDGQVPSSRFGWLGSPHLQVSVKEDRGPRWFCRIHPWLSALLPSLCKDCRKGCSVRARPWSEDQAVLLPPAGGCVSITQLPPKIATLRAKWDWHFDVSVFGYLLGGAVLVFAWRPLRESVAFHAGLGGLGSLLFIGLMVLVWLARSARGTLHGTVPFGRTITTLGAAVLSFVPAARNLLFTWTLRWLPAAHWQAWLELRDPFLGLPIGWLFFLFLVFSCLVLVHLGAKLGVRYFASLPEPEGEVDFLIGSDGRRVDLLPSTPIAQRVLGWAIWSLGVALLLCSTHSDICSLLIAAGILLKDHLGHWLNTWQLWKQAELQPQDLHPLISEDQMKAQAAANTQQALAQLQQYLRENPLTVQSVREDSELRLRRFREDGAHFRQPLVPATEDRASCVLS